MKTAFYGLGLATVVISAGAVHYDVASCVELESIDDTTVTSLTILSTPFECDSYLRFRVRNNMTMKSDSAVVFTNFALKVLGTLIVEPDVTFQNITEQVSLLCCRGLISACVVILRVPRRATYVCICVEILRNQLLWEASCEVKQSVETTKRRTALRHETVYLDNALKPNPCPTVRTNSFASCA